MISRKTAVGMVAVGAAAASMFAATSAYAVAATKITITAGGAAVGTAVTATGTTTTTTAAPNANKLQVKVTGGSGSTTLICPAAGSVTGASGVKVTASTKVVTGQAIGGTNPAPASVTGSTWPTTSDPGKCTGGGGAISVLHGVYASKTATTPSSNTVWPFNNIQLSTPSNSPTTTPVNGQSTLGTLSGIGVTVDYSATCRFTATGSGTGTFTNGNTSSITLNSVNLTVQNIYLSGSATQCALGAIVVGGSLNLDTTIPNPAFTLNVTSPSGANPLRVNAQ